MIELISSWVLTYLAHGIIIGVVAIIARKLPSSAAHRCVIMRIALLAPFLTATIAIAVGNGRSLAVVPFASMAREDVNVQEYHIRGAPPVRTEQASHSPALDVALAIIIVAMGTSVFGAAVAGRRQLRAYRLLSNRVRCETTHGLVLSDIRVSTSETVTIPVALRGREICVSREFHALAAAEQKSVMLHEYAHIERHDPEWLDASRLLATIFCWQPFNRALVRALERDTELAADHVALVRGASAQSLVRALSHFASVVEMTTLTGAALLRDESPLLERARLILSEGKSGQRRGMIPMLIVGAIVIILVFAPRVTTSAGPDRRSHLSTETVQEHVVLR